MYCLKDKLVKKEDRKFLSGLRRETELRNLLWWEHGNKTIEKNGYEKFYGYVVRNWVSRVFPNWEEEIKEHCFLKF